MCGCRKNGGNSRRSAIRPNLARVTTQSTNSPTQLRALGIQSTQTAKGQNQLDEDRRRIEKLRRDTIRKAFNK